MGFPAGGITGAMMFQEPSSNEETKMAKKSPSTGAGEAPDETTPELVTVRVIGQRICEDGIGYSKDETFQTTPERAAALTGLVEVVTV